MKKSLPVGIVVVVMGLFLTSTAWSAQSSAQVFTNGAANPVIKNVDVSGGFNSTGDTCVHADIQGVQPQMYFNATGDCTITKTAKNKAAVLIPGKGETKEPKYDAKGKGLIFRSQGFIIKGTANKDETQSFALARFEAKDPVLDKTTGKRTFSVGQLASASVEPLQNGNQTLPGTAAARVSDPFELTALTSGSFQYDYFLGQDAIEIDPNTGQPFPNLSFFSNTGTGQNYFETDASLTGVQINGMSLNGELFRLIIDVSGPITSASNLNVDFIPSSVLGLSPSMIDTIDSYVKGQLHLLSDGSVGLDLGVGFPLIGSGSPLSTLTFSYLPGTLTVANSLVVSADIVPEPPSWILMSIGIVGLLCIGLTTHGRRRRERFFDKPPRSCG